MECSIVASKVLSVMAEYSFPDDSEARDALSCVVPWLMLRRACVLFIYLFIYICISQGTTHLSAEFQPHTSFLRLTIRKNNSSHTEDTGNTSTTTIDGGQCACLVYSYTCIYDSQHVHAS